MKTIVYIHLLISSFLIYSVALGQDSKPCTETDLGYVKFNENSIRLTQKAKKKLDNLAIIMNTQTTCQIVATGYSKDLCDKCASLSWDRVQAVLTYLEKKGVAQNRMQFTSQLKGDLNIVSIAFTSYTIDKKILKRNKNPEY